MDLDEFILTRVNTRQQRKFEYKYPDETQVIIKLLKQAISKKSETLDFVYNYITIRDYCIEVLGYTMVSKEGLRKIIGRIAKENGCEL